MKNLARTLALSATLVLGLTIGASAQETDKTEGKMRKGGFPELNLTEAQKTQMKANHDAEKANRQKFDATLDASQKAIMADKTVKPKEKMQKLTATLSAEQKAMFKSNREEAKKNNDAFKATLTAEQQEKFGQMKGRMDGKKHDGPRTKKAE